MRNPLQLDRETPAWLVRLWAQFDAHERRDADRRLAYVLAVLSNTIGGGKRVSKDKSEPYQLADFPLLVPPRTRKGQQRTAAAQHVSASQLNAVMASLGGVLPQGRG